MLAIECTSENSNTFGNDVIECPHCNGYGSSFKDPENVLKCSFCGGSGVVTQNVLEQYENRFTTPREWKTGLRRYYLKKTSISDLNGYNFSLFAKIIQKYGGKMLAISTVNESYGKSNVISFDADEKTLPAIKRNLDSLNVFGKYGCVIKELQNN